MAVLCSAHTGEGIAALVAALARALAGRGADTSEGGLARLLLARHRDALAAARAALAEARGLLDLEAPLDLVAEALRAALGSLDELAGRTTSEDVLDRIFARFCLGK
jgi:tRNA modification GTPase